MANPFVETASGLFGGILSGSFYVLIGLVIAGIIVGFAIWYRYKKQFDILVEITSERAEEEHSLFFDKAAILKDKGGKTKYLRLLMTKVDLPVPPFNIIEKTNRGDVIRLWRKSDDEFVYMTRPDLDRQTVIKQDGKIYKVAQKEYKQLEGDVSYWNVKRKESHKKMFSSDSLLTRLLPFIPHIIAGVMIVFILYVLLDGLPQLINTMSQLATQMAELVREMQTLSGATSNNAG